LKDALVLDFYRRSCDDTQPKLEAASACLPTARSAARWT